MKNLMLLFVCLVIMISQGCNDDDICLQGSGRLESYILPVTTIEGVSLSGPINLRITQSNEDKLEVACEPEVFTELEYSERSEHLDIGFEDNVRCLNDILEVWVNLQVRDISTINISGISKIENTGDLALNRLSIQVEGMADIMLTGTANEQNISVEGSANIYNSELLTESTTVYIEGSAEVEVACTDFLDIDVEGSGKISYVGSPQIEQDVKGQLQLIKID